ncbi:MAG: thymidine kinase [Chloroflexi bacterium]|nr:thymidine kinase [Chloroflexota bacterium]MDL1942242.1 thymidine kinase [Chloroflexi bacterium CFX2]
MEYNGRLEVICGCMYSGKTEELIRRVRRVLIARRDVQVFKSHRDTRYSKYEVTSHTGEKVNAIVVPKDPHKETTSSEEFLKLINHSVNVIAVDEIQFFDENMANICNHLANLGKRVIVAGLDLDFRGLPFRGPMSTLLAYADSIDKLHAVCSVCGETASMTQRFIGDRPAKWDETIYVVGGHDIYKAVCRKHHYIQVPNDLSITYKVEDQPD